MEGCIYFKLVLIRLYLNKASQVSLNDEGKNLFQQFFERWSPKTSLFRQIVFIKRSFEFSAFFRLRTCLLSWNIRQKFKYLMITSFRTCLFMSVLLALFPLSTSITSASPIWISSSYFKAGSVTFQYAVGVSDQNMTITYSSAMVNTNLKRPVLGITDLNYMIVGGRFYLLIQIMALNSYQFTFNVAMVSSSYLTTLKLTYMALDSSFTPAFSMTTFTAVGVGNGPNLSKQFPVNFTDSTGVILNTSHQNVLLPFMHYVDAISYDSTMHIGLEFNLLNGSFYVVKMSTTSNLLLNKLGFSRLIFDKTAIEALGSDYFNYGIVTASNNDDSALCTTIPPDIMPSNLFYGIHSFNVQTGLSKINFASSYNVTSGFIGFMSKSFYVYSQMKFSYMHHKTRICPSSNPYYNISQLLCYDQCADGWYADIATMLCKKCPYDCTTCSGPTTCTNCDAVSNKRQLSNSRCSALPGYYDNGANSVAQPCNSPCETCLTTATFCLSCISGYYLKSAKCLSCSAALPKCITCTNSTFCTLCTGGGNGTSCTSCPSNQYYNTTNDACQSCSSAINNCLSCTSNIQCTLCQNTYTLNSPTDCSCSTNQYQSNQQCNSCASAISDCNICTNANTCTSCMNTFTLFSATNCACSSDQYLDKTDSSCKSCTLITPYCQSCINSACNFCMNTFTLTTGTCRCSSGTYANSTTKKCQNCSIISKCLICNDVSKCTKCSAGYKANTTTGVCDIQPCTVGYCDTCLGKSTTICQGCQQGYSVGPNGSSCLSFCGNYAIDPSQECDDGNSVSGDGCSSSCRGEKGFSCYNQYINTTNTYSWCFYTSNISFSKIWIRKFQGNNSLKFSFQLDQLIKQWETVNFTSILGIDRYEKITNNTLGMTSSIIQSYYAEYQPSKNRLWVIVNYINYTMEKTNLYFSLSPYSHHTYPAFSPPNNVEFDTPIIEVYTSVTANNNQNANLYTAQQYSLYSVSVSMTYFVVGLALFGVFTSLIFRSAKVIAFEMITIMQITYFSLAFLDSMNPVFSGMLPLRYLAGILTFQDVESYLEQNGSPNSMKGVYMYLNLSENISWLALGITCFLGLGLLLLLAYFIYDYVANPKTLQAQSIAEQHRKGYQLHKLAFHFIGQLSLSLIFLCLPIFTISLFFQILFTIGKLNFWSYAEAFGLGLAIFGYFVALIKASLPKEGSFSGLGQYISQFNCVGCFETFKYCNFQIIQNLVISGLVMTTIYSNSKVFSSLCIVLTAVLDIVIVAVVKPYRFGFVSCFKGQDNQTQVIFQKIELYKVYDKLQPSVVRLEQPENDSQKSQVNQNKAEFFAQHFATIRSVVKSKHQGLVQAGQILNHTKLFLFNNNTRRIINLATLIGVQFVFICSQIYSAEINRSYYGITIQNFLPLLIHIMLTANVVYNYIMIVLQILDRKAQMLVNGELDNESAITLNKSLYTQPNKINMKEPTSQTSQAASFNNTKEILQTNLLIIKGNSNDSSLYDLKRPQIIKTGKRLEKKPRKKVNIQATQI